MLKIKVWKLCVFSSICFLLIGIENLIEKKYLLGGCDALIGVTHILLSITYYKRDNKSNQIKVPDTVLKNLDIELRSLIVEAKKIKAIKKYRIVTGIGLKEAKEYVDLLSEENSN